ncbi:MAG: GreA/GreB family elongation factor [Bryobacteraceae bacterium]
MSEADADRLSVLHRFVRSQVEAQHLAALEEKIAEAEVLEPEQMPHNVVTMNSQVRVTDIRTGVTAVYTLVFPSSADARKNRVSVLGALGTALLGSRVGDVVCYHSSAGEECRRIDEIIYQPEAAGDIYG